MELTLGQRKAITRVQLDRWSKATRAEKSAILDAVCGVTGWHRDHARKVIRQALAEQAGGGPAPRKAREPVTVYGPEAVELLTRCWAILDGPTGKRLHPALPGVIANLERHGHLSGVDEAVIAQVLAMSPATIDRRLADARSGMVARKPIAHTRPGSMLKSSIPMKTWHEWNDTQPGFLQIDLVGHEGGDNNGAFFYTLDATDIATGWTEAISVRSKGERIVATGLEELRLRFPFHIAGIHSDNGSERARPAQPALAPDLATGQPLPAPAEADRQDPHRRHRPQDLRHRRHPAAPPHPAAPSPARPPRPRTTRGPHPQHRPHRPAAPDRRHPRQPHRARPTPRPGPHPHQDQRHLPQPPKNHPTQAGKTH